MSSTLEFDLLVIADRLEEIDDPGCHLLRAAVADLKGTKPSQRKELLLFCEQDSIRYVLNKPWVQDGFVYATDARIAVALKTDEPDSPPPEEGRSHNGAYMKRPNVRSLMNIVPQPAEWMPIASLGVQDREGDGVCWECFGLQRVLWHEPLAQTEGCPVCDASGGVSDGPTQVDVGGALFSRHYIEMIKTLSRDAEVGAIPDEDKGDVLRFRFEGGEGLLMGMK